MVARDLESPGTTVKVYTDSLPKLTFLFMQERFLGKSVEIFIILITERPAQSSHKMSLWAY